MTLCEAITWGTGALRAVPELAGNAARDAELLLLNLMALTRAQLRAYPDQLLPVAEWKQFEERIARRLRMEPIQYITGEQEFYGHRLHVSPAVLIPRPETELLVEQVLTALPVDRPLRLLDVGTGSGAIAIALAIQLPEAEITAIDVSSDALTVATGNAEAHGVAARIRFVESDLLSAITGEQFNAIVSNPPYVSSQDRESLHPEVREYEPALALFAGETGSDIYQRLIPEAAAALYAGGLLALEIGFDQQAALISLLTGWCDVSFHDDLQSIARVVLARRSS